MFPVRFERRFALRPGSVARGAALLAVVVVRLHGADGEMLLRDFKPHSMLQLPETRVERARFPVIDVHNHVNDTAALARPHPSPEEVIRWMDACNVERVFARHPKTSFIWLHVGNWPENLDYSNAPGQGRWKIYGLGLPDAVLEKVYHQNAERILGLATR